MINSTYSSEENIKKLQRQFAEAVPCKHLILDNFLSEDIANQLYENFPKMDELNVRRKSLNENKAEGISFRSFSSSFNQVKKYLNTPEMNKWISEVVDIPDLFSTDDALGCGLHQGPPESFVDVHIDVNVNTQKGLHRRINLLIYLNKEWQDDYGGALELWDKEMKECIVSTLPNFNRAVIFLTDENSPHGYSKVNIPDHETRKSMYCYYYTPLTDGVKYKDSKFLSRPDDPIHKKALTSVKEKIKLTLKSTLNKLGMSSLDFQDKNKE